MKFLVFVILFVSPAAFAKPFVLLKDPSKMECVLNEDTFYPRCNILYAGQIVYEGFQRIPAMAGADCLSCKNVKEEAIEKGARILMDRALSWNQQNFLTLTFKESVTPVCE